RRFLRPAQRYPLPPAPIHRVSGSRGSEGKRSRRSHSRIDPCRQIQVGGFTYHDGIAVQKHQHIFTQVRLRPGTDKYFIANAIIGVGCIEPGGMVDDAQFIQDDECLSADLRTVSRLEGMDRRMTVLAGIPTDRATEQLRLVLQVPSFHTRQKGQHDGHLLQTISLLSTSFRKCSSRVNLWRKHWANMRMRASST